MSINDVPEVRTMFAAHHITPVTTTYHIAKGAAQTGRQELLISNFSLPETSVQRAENTPSKVPTSIFRKSPEFLTSHRYY